MMKTVTPHEKRILESLYKSAHRVRAEQELQRSLVTNLRDHEVSWETIAQMLGVTKQAAQQRFTA